MADNRRKLNSLQTIEDMLRTGKGREQVEFAKFEDGAHLFRSTDILVQCR